MAVVRIDQGLGQKLVGQAIRNAANVSVNEAYKSIQFCVGVGEWWEFKLRWINGSAQWTCFSKLVDGEWEELPDWPMDRENAKYLFGVYESLNIWGEKKGS